jgi:hypothetical protein
MDELPRKYFSEAEAVNIVFGKKRRRKTTFELLKVTESVKYDVGVF